jgi:hypothetical protein
MGVKEVLPLGCLAPWGRNGSSSTIPKRTRK